MSEEATTGFRGAWRHRRWRRLVVSYSVSCTGDLLYAVALAVALGELTDNPAAWLAAALVGRMASYIVIGPIGAALVGRFDRRRTLIVLNLVRAVLMGVGAALLWGGGASALALVVLTTLDTVGTALYRPAAAAATPELVPEDDLVAANAAEVLVEQIGFFVGPALGALIVALADPGTGFALNALTYVVAAALLVGLGDLGGRRATASAVPAGPADATDGRSSELGRGVTALRRTVGLGQLAAVIGACSVVPGFERVAHVLVAQERLGMGPTGVGVLAAAVGVGGLVVAPFSGRISQRWSAPTLLLVGSALIGLPLALLSVIDDPVLACAVLALEGVGVIIHEVVAITLLQRACPRDALGDVHGVLLAMSAAGFVVGSVAAPLLDATVGLAATLVVAGSVPLLVTVASAPGLRRLAAGTEDDAAQRRVIVDRLAAAGIFGDGSLVSLASIARDCTRRTVAAGTVLFHQGDAADRVYVIESGAFVASGTGDGSAADGGAGPAWSTRMEAGDVFGEIGVLHGVPRTGTVRCEADGAVVEVPAAAFESAAVWSAPPLMQLMGMRLARTHPTMLARPVGVS